MLNGELDDCYKKVCDLRKINDQKPKNVLSQEVVNINGLYENATFDINKACHYLNDFTNDTLKGRTSAYTISVGKGNAPLIVSIKQLSDDIYKADMNSSDINSQETLQLGLSKAEDNLHRIEDLCKSTNKFIQNLEYLVKYFKNQGKLDKNLSSEISSFLDKDVVTSSPINSSK